MVRFYDRLLKLDSSRLLKRVYLWDKYLNDCNMISTWSSEVQNIFCDVNQPEIFNSVGCYPIKLIIENLKAIMFDDQQNRLKQSCGTFPKLRTFIKIKDFSKTSPCLTLALSFIQRSTITKARLGCLPIRLETGRYTRPCIPAEGRYCLVCSNPNKEVECIYHVIFSCNVYSDERKCGGAIFYFLNIAQPMHSLSLNQNKTWHGCVLFCTPCTLYSLYSTLLARKQFNPSALSKPT